MNDLITPQGVAEYMRGSLNEHDWNDRCDAVKAAHGGDYPSFWYETVIMAGIAHEVFNPPTDEPLIQNF